MSNSYLDYSLEELIDHKLIIAPMLLEYVLNNYGEELSPLSRTYLIAAKEVLQDLEERSYGF